jgi:hypothetical protein
MMQMLLREWEKLKYHDPGKVLVQFRKIEMIPDLQALPEKVRSLITNKLKFHKQGREAALFCYGLGHLLKSNIHFANYERADYDFITYWKDGDDLERRRDLAILQKQNGGAASL